MLLPSRRCAAPLGAYYSEKPLEYVVAEARASAEVTHTHPEGVAGAVAVAVATALSGLEGEELLRTVAEWTPAGMVQDGIRDAISLLTLDDPRSASATLGNGREVSAQETVPFCLWVVAKHPDDYAAAFWAAASAGGDVDTNCAIVGGIIGARVGVPGIPGEWLERCEALPDWVAPAA